MRYLHNSPTYPNIVTLCFLTSGQNSDAENLSLITVVAPARKHPAQDQRRPVA